MNNIDIRHIPTWRALELLKFYNVVDMYKPCPIGKHYIWFNKDNLHDAIKNDHHGFMNESSSQFFNKAITFSRANSELLVINNTYMNIHFIVDRHRVHYYNHDGYNKLMDLVTASITMVINGHISDKTKGIFKGGLGVDIKGKSQHDRTIGFTAVNMYVNHMFRMFGRI